MARWLLCLCMLVALASGRAAPAAAQTAPPAGTPHEVTTEDLKGLVGTLENDAARQKLIAELQVLIAAREHGLGGQATPAAAAQSGATPSDTAGAQLIIGISERLRQVSASLADGAAAVSDFPTIFDWLRRQVADPETRLGWLETFGKLIVVLGLAVAGQNVASYALRRARRAVADRPGAATWLRLVLMLPRLLIDLVPIAAFAALADVVLPFMRPDEIVSITAVATVNAVVVVRSAIVVASTALAAPAPTLALFRIGAETAGYWLEWFRRLVRLAVYGYFAAEAALLLGLPTGIYDLATRVLGLVLAGLVAVVILQNRDEIASRIRGAPPGQGRAAGVRLLRARLAEVWHVIALIYVAAIYGVWALQISGGFNTVMRATIVSVIAIVGARAFDLACEALLRRFLAVSPELKGRFPGLQHRVDLYLSGGAQGLRVIVYVLAALVLLQAWGVGAFAWIASDAGRRVVGASTTIAITAIATLLAWEAISFAFEYYLARQAPALTGHQRRVRARTLLPLLHKVVAIMLIAMASLITLSELGVNIAPLLAGAGIVGIAIGFGAQNLVKDVITGLFILFEDTVAIGDVVTIGDSTGVVEAVSIRDLRLRGDRGALHTIPFSAVTKVINMTKDFAYASFDIVIGQGDKIDAAIEAIRGIGKEII
ncbi:MAG: mechanosensitive ion channel domain-containing protein, partial [Stellaceae bacterium]